MQGVKCCRLLCRPHHLHHPVTQRSEAPLGSCSNPVLLSDLPPSGQVTLTTGEANCTHMQRSWNMFWGVPWDAGYLLPANFSAHRLLTIDTCLPGVAGSVVGYPVHLTVTALASTSSLCALAAAGALRFANGTFTQSGCGGSLSFTARVGQAYLIVVSGTTSGYVSGDGAYQKHLVLCHGLRCATRQFAARGTLLTPCKTFPPLLPSSPLFPFIVAVSGSAANMCSWLCHLDSVSKMSHELGRAVAASSRVMTIGCVAAAAMMPAVWDSIAQCDHDQHCCSSAITSPFSPTSPFFPNAGEVQQPHHADQPAQQWSRGHQHPWGPGM
ncbi:hypothetical protein HaLaN_18683 [Haematococcus lacustris]|uniref:Uncharacterized protein n=1 Tax=Haematococcus lacustris TaxID=44745 RepID=A0A699ZFA0_HAELA|nr:hypothetical protein HaLaN_18683 [Haematococcus lacustris]